MHFNHLKNWTKKNFLDLNIDRNKDKTKFEAEEKLNI